MANSDSPVSQLLQHALAPAAQSQEHSKEWGPASPNDGRAALDFSMDSRIIPARPATPRYRLQFSSPQSAENSREFVLAEGSQKENQHQQESELGTCHITSPAPSKNVPVQLGSGSDVFHEHRFSPITASAQAVKVIGTRTLSFQSPPTTGLRPFSQPTKSMPVGNRQYRRSPSPISQDSFGGPISQDPAELYLATAKEFDVPLSNLGETPTQEVVHSPTDPGLTLPDASEHKEFLEAAMREYEEQRANRATTSRVKVLVAATPSNSDEPAGMSQHNDDDISFRNHGPEFTPRESRYEFNGSSSFDKMLDRGLADPTPEPSQPKEKQPPQVNDIVDTQPSSGHGIATTPLHSSEHDSPPFDWTAPTPSTKVASSNPRSLLRMVHPQNQYRITMMRHLAGDVEPPSRVTVGAETQPSHTEDSQPVKADGSTSSNAFPPARPAPRQNKISSSRLGIHQPHSTNDEPEDSLDVVPDSEPLRAGPSTQTPSRHSAVRRGSPKKPFQPCSPMSDIGFEDIVPDSLEVEESEADIPLAAGAALKETKRSVAHSGDVPVHSRKTRTTSNVPVKTPLPAPAPEKQAQKPILPAAKRRNSRAKPSKLEPVGVPTSLPEQDLQSSSGKPPDSANSLPPKPKRRGPLPSESSRAQPPSTTRPSATKPVAGEKRAHKSDTESSEDLSRHPSKGGVSMHPKAQREEEEEGTDSADDYNVDSLSSSPPKPDVSRQKRRRTDDANPARGMGKASTSSRAKRSETPAVATRSAMRLRSGLSSIRAPQTESATRVFALWKQDGHYYSGILYSRRPQNKYVVKFDDGTRDEVELGNLRHRNLVVGDRVIICDGNIKGTVCDVTDADSLDQFTLEVDGGDSISIVPAKFDDICIANRTIQSQWKERTVDPETIVTVVSPKPIIDATPSKQSLVSTVTIKTQRELVKTGFVVTIAPRNSASTQTKDEAMRAIKRRGGVVIDDWSSVLAVEGKYSQGNKRWIATPEDIRWKSRAGVDRVFLLSDDASQTPKFLLALALGIPCISFDWLTGEGELSLDWQQYLLPAGYSHSLGARVSQLVDLDWGNCTEHLTDIMGNKASIKLFSRKAVLLVGAELVPPPTNRTRKNASDDPGRYCAPWTVLCMGAAKVEAVADAKLLSPNDMQAFDYIIYKERDDLGSIKVNGDVVVGSWNWVKDCLIAARLGPPILD